MDEETQSRLQALPSVTELLDAAVPLRQRYGTGTVTAAIRQALADARSSLLAGGEFDLTLLPYILAQRTTTLRRVINATGVVVHTNLGRAPLAEEVLEAVEVAGRGYCNLEYDVGEGRRGSRHLHAKALLCELTGAEDACVVNNNAAAVFLILSALAQGREVVVSRGELIEIGGSFRVPDIMASSGARLVEVGTTNRTRVADYEASTGDDTAMWLKVHRSNFAMVGFTEEPTLEELARAADAPLVYDAGSGSLLPQAGEPTISQALSAGCDVVCFSGDKLLGGPQAGLIVGKAPLIKVIKEHPLMRALRPDKLCLAALSSTLRLWRDDPERLPLHRMLASDDPWLLAQQHRAARWLKEIDGATLVMSKNRVGGGASPLYELPGVAVSLPGGDELLAKLRARSVPIIARAHRGRVLLELRTIDERDDDDVIAALLACV